MPAAAVHHQVNAVPGLGPRTGKRSHPGPLVHA
ncbi:hypothetical protein F4553_005304 [Allocatelliglobosispora scoriae]|uniref:Uncharacterized protein n=1 Tax=Allocatelliglobosispora scoriae TaxID=643052 RepID=A0A841BW76_9ACTN|nr:hypothetical protein [Allocatelliglobosispora scoriae]